MVVFSCGLLSLIAALWFYRPAVICFLCVSLYLAFCDQARWQPWFYMYFVMLLLSLANEATAIGALRVAISAVYLWSGIQKCNPDYFKLAVPWLANTGMEWLPGFAGMVLRGALQAAPVVELFIGLAVWFRATRRAAIVGTTVVHATALFLLGPLGHKHNWIVWPWNLVMPVLLLVLFPSKGVTNPWMAIGRTRWATVVVVLFAGLPVLSFFGYWDSYLSFSLYTGRLTKADIFISEEVKNRLPEAVRPFVVPTPAPFNRDLQGPYVVLVELWADKVLRVPPLPEARGYRRVAEYLAKHASNPDDVRLVLIPRVGPVVFHRGSDLRKKSAIPLKL
jgi:hypothetical protein